MSGGVLIGGEGGTKSISVGVEKQPVATIAKLDAISPIDGRYRKDTEPLARFFSEGALIRYRVTVEVEYLIALSERGIIPREFSPEEKKLLRSLYESMTLEDANIVKQIETRGYKDIKATNHDVKAVEYYLQDKLKGTSLTNSLQWIHFALTSTDTDNIAYALMTRDAMEQVILPVLGKVLGKLYDLANAHAEVAMPGRTHGQVAVPTTFGKELANFAERLRTQREQLNKFMLLAKLNGATGNYNAQMAAFPNVDWEGFSVGFIQNFNSIGERGHLIWLDANLTTTQIEPHDRQVELFDTLRRINTILIGFSQDAWRYISDDWLVQVPVAGEVGSSTMPQKVNPIDFENAEGNLGVANALLGFFATKLPISRLQRDLSDSTVERNFGVAFSHTLQGYNALLKGLGKVHVNEAKVRAELAKHPEVLAEAYQTILRREGFQNAYELLRGLTRRGEGVGTTLEEMHAFVDTLDVPERVKEEMKALTPENYIGLAPKLARNE